MEFPGSLKRPAVQLLELRNIDGPLGGKERAPDPRLLAGKMKQPRALPDADNVDHGAVDDDTIHEQLAAGAGCEERARAAAATGGWFVG